MYLFARLFFALDLQERERAHGLARAARMERAKRLADRAVLEGAAHGDERVVGVIAKRGRERDLFFRRPPVVGSNHEGWPRARSSERGSTSPVPAFVTTRRTRRSPFSAMSRRTPLSGASRAR